MSSHQLLWCCQAIYKALSKAEQAVANGFQNIESLSLCDGGILIVAKYHKKQLTIGYAPEFRNATPGVMKNAEAKVEISSSQDFTIVLHPKGEPRKKGEPQDQKIIVKVQKTGKAEVEINQIRIIAYKPSSNKTMRKDKF
eukprot:GHVS01038820.1.p1 GENE.GHVS01038820.1~~GHVS01038820.1.p1  ORF type:complete len:140 (+),score=13.45 GHVS01038820.1:42-461(+)